MLADEEFTGTEAGGALINSAFGWPAFISANTLNTGPAFFVAAPGVRVEQTLSDSTTVRAGIFDGDSFDSPSGDASVTRHGLHYRVGGSQGWFGLGEVAFAPANSPARFKAGAWIHTAKFADMRDDQFGGRIAASGRAARLHERNYGAYGIAERTLAGKSGEAGFVTAYARAGISPKDRNSIGWAVDSGLACTGLFPGRAADVTAFGVVHASFSPRLAAFARVDDPSAPAPDFEQVFEISHTATLSERFSVQPDVQFVRHPGGSTALSDAFVIQLRVKASF